MSRSATLARPSHPSTPTGGPGTRLGFMRGLDRRRDVVQNVTPNWFASIMGTGILAVAAAGLAPQRPGLQLLATAVWMFATIALIALMSAFLVHWARHREVALAHLRHPVTGQFYGALPMALLTVGTGTLVVGHRLIGEGTARIVDLVLWSVGTALGLLTTAVATRRLLGRGRIDRSSLLPAHLMPVVPPMVSATAAALLIPHLAASGPRTAMLLAGYGLFGLSLAVGLPVLVVVLRRLIRSGPPTGAAAPTVWIMLGLIGQSITAVNLLGHQSRSLLPPSVATALTVFALVYGLVMGGFGAVVIGIVGTVTVRAFRGGLPFALTWWSFIFPVGTCVTGATALAATVATLAPALGAGSAILHGLAVALFVVLLVAWGTVASLTVRGSWSGRLFAR